MSPSWRRGRLSSAAVGFGQGWGRLWTSERGCEEPLQLGNGWVVRLARPSEGRTDLNCWLATRGCILLPYYILSILALILLVLSTHRGRYCLGCIKDTLLSKCSISTILRLLLSLPHLHRKYTNVFPEPWNTQATWNQNWDRSSNNEQQSLGWLKSPGEELGTNSRD